MMEHQEESFEQKRTGKALKESTAIGGQKNDSARNLKEKGSDSVHILIVDDDKPFGQMLESVIRKLTGFDCSFVESARKALEVLEERVVDVVITDIKMPDMSGIELTRIIKEKYASDVIVITGYYEDFTYEEAIENGANDFIEKPVRPTELILRLKRILRERAILYKRKQAEELLKKTEQELRLIFDTAPSLIWQKDREGRYLQVNKTYCDTIGLSKDAILGKTDYDLFHKEIADQYLSHDRKVLDSGMPEFGIEEYHQKPSGEYGWSRTDRFIYHDVDGKINGMIGFATDITERKRAEEELKATRKQMELILGTTKTGLDIIDSEYNLRYIDPEWAKVYGDTAGKKCYEYFMGQKQVCPGCGIAKALETKKPVVTEEILVREGNRPIQVTTIPFQNEKGEWLVAEVNVDITERKQAEQMLRQSEENFRRSLDDSPLGVRIVTTEGETIYANRAILDIYGYDNREELKATPVVKRYTPESFAKYQIRMEKRRQGNHDPSEYEVNIVRKDGEVRHLQVFRKEILWDGERQSQVLYNDITDRKILAGAIQAERDKLETVTRNVGAGLAIISKDYRTVWANDVIRNIFGETEGKLCYVRYNLQQTICPWCGVRRVFEAGEDNVVTEAEGYDKDGNRIWSQIIATPIRDESGEVTAALEVVIPITERKRAEEELRNANKRLRALAKRQQQIREESMIMIAREIHDELGGGLTGLKMELTSVLQKLSDVGAGKEERVALMNKIFTSSELMDQMIQVVRRIATDLRPSVLDDLGLVPALEWQLEEFTSRTEIPHEFATDFEYANLEEATATAVFRIFQEVLTNVARHSGATKVAVVLRKEEGSLFLEIRDNGRGIAEGEIMDIKSLGILGMRERALVFGGELRISGEPDSGTVVVLKIPEKPGEPS